MTLKGHQQRIDNKNSTIRVDDIEGKHKESTVNVDDKKSTIRVDNEGSMIREK